MLKFGGLAKLKFENPDASFSSVSHTNQTFVHNFVFFRACVTHGVIILIIFYILLSRAKENLKR